MTFNQVGKGFLPACKHGKPACSRVNRSSIRYHPFCVGIRTIGKER
jgi:hypothetical protein